MTNDVLVLLSGGQDSTTCLFWVIHSYPISNIHALTINYGQRHHRELEAATKVFEEAAKDNDRLVSHEVLNVGSILQGTSPLVDHAKPVEQYADAASLPTGLENTFVPLRNQLFLTLAANRASVMGCSAIVIGVSQEDYDGYPDCRNEFMVAFETATHLALNRVSTARRIRIITPLLYRNKSLSVSLANELPGCMDALAYSHTCYNNAYPPCGTCHACLLRAEGFAVAGIPDPLITRAGKLDDAG